MVMSASSIKARRGDGGVGGTVCHGAAQKKGTPTRLARP